MRASLPSDLSRSCGICSEITDQPLRLVQEPLSIWPLSLEYRLQPLVGVRIQRDTLPNGSRSTTIGSLPDNHPWIAFAEGQGNAAVRCDGQLATR